MPEMYAGELEKAPEKVTVDPKTRQATFSDLELSEPGRYFLQFDCLSSTSGKKYHFVGSPVDVYPANYTRPEIKMEKQVAIKCCLHRGIDTIVVMACRKKKKCMQSYLDI